MMKNIFIFILFTSQIWAKLSDFKLGGWRDMTPEQGIELSGLLGDDQSQITVKEGKMQVVSGINYAVVFNHPDTGDCFSTFTFVAFDQSNPIHELSLDPSTQQQMLGAVSGVNPCSQENLGVLFSKFAKLNEDADNQSSSQKSGANSSEMDDISIRSDNVISEQDFVGGWKDIDEEDVLSIGELMGLDDDRVKILEGKMQLVAGVNYVLLVQIDDNDPCLLPFNFVSWKKEDKYTALPLEMFESSELLNSMSVQVFCEEMVVSQELASANVHASKPLKEIKMKTIVKNLWKEFSQEQTNILNSTLALEEKELTILEAPRVNTLNNMKISVLVQENESDPCVFMLFLNSQDQTLGLVDLEAEPHTSMMTIFYKDKNPCGEEITEPIASGINPKEDYMKLFYSYYIKEEAEIKAVLQESKFEEWKFLSVAQIGAVSNFIKSEDKVLKPVLGLSYIDEGIDYILIMRDNWMHPCTMYVSFTSSSGNKTFLYTSLLDNDLTKDILHDIPPCDQNNIAEYLEVTQKFLLI